MQRTILIKATLLSACILFSAVTIAEDAGMKTYNDACKVCHEAGIAGSPKFGDADA